MKQLRVILAGITALSACSGGREQRVPVNDRVAQQSDLTLPDTLSRKDTSVTLSSQSCGAGYPSKAGAVGRADAQACQDPVERSPAPQPPGCGDPDAGGGGHHGPSLCPWWRARYLDRCRQLCEEG